MAEYVKKVEFSDMEENMRLLKWKKYIVERQKQRKRNITLAKLSKSLMKKKAIDNSNKLTSKNHSQSRHQNHDKNPNVATLDCDLDIAPYLNCSN